MTKRLLSALLSLSLALIAQAQHDYYFRHYQVENGLSHNTVMCSAQDAQGFLWLGTKDGLNRFDGTSFKVFRHDEDDSTTLGNNYIRYLHLDPSGRLFAGTQRGLYEYHPRTESFTHISSSGNKSIKEIFTDSRGNLWYIAEGLLVQYREKENRVRNYDVGKYFWATSMCTTSDGTFWVATADGLLEKYDPAHDSFTPVDVLRGTGATTRWIEKIYAGSDRLFIGTAAHGLLSFDCATQTPKTIISQNSDGTGIFVRDILHYQNDEYWIATESGLFVYNEATGHTVNLKKNYHNPYTISDNAVYTLCRDKEGGLWAGTFFGGVNYYAQNHAVFRKYFPDYSRNTISGNAVREIVKDKYGNLWVGTEDAGLNKIDAKGAITHFMPTGRKGSLSYYNIHGLLAVNDELWVGTFEHGLDILDIRTGRVLRHYDAGDRPGNLRSNFVFSIYQTRSGQILLGTTAGVFRYQPSSDSFLPVPQLNGYTYDIIEDRSGVWWTATISDGIKFFNPATGAGGNYQYNPRNKESLSNNMVNSLFEDSRGNLWIATEGGGVCRLSADRKKLRRFTTRNGLPSDYVFKILEDEKGWLWITTSQGLVQLDGGSGAVKVFTSANGLLNDQFNYNSGFRDDQGRLYFGSVKGMIRFNPQELMPDRFLAPVYFTGFQVNNRELPIRAKGSLPQSIVYTQSVELPYNQSSFSIDFATLSFTAPQMNGYAYKMEGVDQKWTYLEKNRKVYFTDLAPGHYVFRLKTANSSGVWNPKQAELSITILPPWWKSTLAYTVYALLVIGLLVLLTRSYHRYIRNENQRKMDHLHFEKEKEIYEAKMKFFTNIAHEIRTPLTLIKGPLERVIKKTEDIPGIRNSLTIMERNTNRLLDLTNQLLDYRQTEAGGFTLSFTEENITRLLRETYMSFKPLAEQKKLHYSIHLPSAPLITYADGEAMLKILNNLVGNALKYADRQVRIYMTVNHARNSFSIEIRNDGHPVPPDMREKIFEPFVRLKKSEKQEGTGIGLALARSLTELHQGYLRMKDDETLNIFELVLPLRGEWQSKENNSAPKNILETNPDHL